MPNSFKSIILIILLLLGVSPLYGNLPCENGCENSCKCEKEKSPTDDSATCCMLLASLLCSGGVPPRLSFGGEYSFLWFL